MRKAVVLSLLAAALLAGCGGDDGPPSATDWADDLCSALGDWTDSLTSAAQSVILMVLVIALTVVQFRFIERRVHY